MTTPEVAATYFDGVSASPQPVTLILEDTALGITSAAGAQLARWDYSAIEQLPAAADRLRLGLAENSSTARLELRDPAFADAVKQRLGFGTPQYQARERRHRRLVVAWSAAAVAAVLAIGVAGLPAIAELLVPLVPPSREVQIGAAIHQQEMENYRVKGPRECGDAGVNERAGKAVAVKLLRQLEAAANLPIPVRLFIIRTGEINAGALPGGFMHVNMGLIQFAQSPDELAGVLGHELGHLAHRHSLRGYLHSVGLAYLAAMTLGDVFTGGGVILASYNVLDRRNTRAQERQADAYGVQLMARLGADSHAVAAMWDRMEIRERDAEKKRQSLRALLSYTHPASAERAVAIRATPRVDSPKPLLTPEEWKTLKLVCSGE